MATMATTIGYAGDIQFQDVEDAVDFVRAGVRLTNRAGMVVRLICKAVVFNQALALIIEKQATLIDRLNGPKPQGLGQAVLADLADRIEHLVKLDDELLDSIYPGKYEMWNEKLVKIAHQRDTLESIAESFRMACDFEAQTLLVSALHTVCV
jgi:hypothetical protein